MKLINKLTLGHLIVGLLVIAVAFAGISTINHINVTFNEVAEQTVPALKAVEDARTAGLKIAVYTSEFAFINPENRTIKIALESEEKELVESSIKQYDAAILQYEELVNKYFSQERDLLENIKSSGGRLKKISAELIALKEQNASGSIVLEKWEEFEEAQQEFLKATNDAITYEDRKFAERKQGVEHAIATSVKNILIAGLLTFIIAIVLGVNISKSISKPIIKLKNAAVELGKGKLDTRVDIKSSDEVGILAACFNQMADRLEQDITERNQVETALRESEERYQTLTKLAPVGVFHTDAQGLCTYVNDKMSEITGLSTEQMYGLAWAQSLHPDDRDRVLDEWDTARHKNLPFNSESRFMKPDGELTWVIAQAVAETGNAGEVIGYVGTVTNITERKRAEEALRESEEKYRALMNDADDAIILADTEGNVIEVNKKAEELLGYTKKELLNMHITQITPKEEIDRTIAAFKETAKKGSGSHFLGDGVILRKDGKKVHVDITGSPIKYEDKILMQGVFRDISERKKAEELRFENERLAYADRAKSEFLSKMSHELRTPLNAIMGFSELMQTEELNEKQKRYIDNIYESGKHLLSIISGILDLVQVESGREIELVINRFSVSEAIDVSLNYIKNKAAQRNVVIKKELDPQLGFIEADEQRFRQILINLLYNAVKFSKPERGAVTITAKKEGDMARFSVMDTGIGIKEEDLGKLFQRFEQLESGTTRKYGGSGLGLAISKQLVELHGGKIRAESKFGEGSTFTFTLPLKAYKKEENK